MTRVNPWIALAMDDAKRREEELPARSGWRKDVAPSSGTDRPTGPPRRARERGELYVHTDHNPDEVRVFYEVPDAVAALIRPAGDPRTFAQALADLAIQLRTEGP